MAPPLQVAAVLAAWLVGVVVAFAAEGGDGRLGASERCEWMATVAPNPDPPIHLVAVVIDTSASTQRSAGFDLDGDGRIGRDSDKRALSSDPEDTLLAAELWAACLWLRRHLDSDTAAALISFSGSSEGPPHFLDPARRDALLRVPFGRDGTSLAAGLRAIRVAGASGATNYAAALQLAREVLVAEPRGASRRILFLTDGMPTLPHPPPHEADAEDVEAALREARLASAEGIRVDSLTFGARPAETAREISEITAGKSAQVADSSDLDRALESLDAEEAR